MIDQRNNNRLWQYVGGVILLLVLVLIISRMDERASLNLLFGVLFGFTLQRSRFCFVSCARDPILFGNTRSVNALLLSLAIMTVAFPIIQNIQLQSLGKVVGQIHPVGIHTAVGALLFGFGMVIAGACASGTLMRVGEGYLMQVIVLVGFLIGVLFGVLHFGWWYDNFIVEAPIIYLPQYFGWIGAVVFQLSVLLGLYFFIKYYSARKKTSKHL